MSGCGGCEEISLPLGQDGVDGYNAFNITVNQFTQPAAQAAVTITVSTDGQYTNAWASPGQVIYIVDANGNGGYYQVLSIVGSNQIEIINLGYPDNAPESVFILAGAKVSPAGIRGPQGLKGDKGDSVNGTGSGILVLSDSNFRLTNSVNSQVEIYSGVIPAGSAINTGDAIYIDIPIRIDNSVYGAGANIYVILQSDIFQFVAIGGYVYQGASFTGLMRVMLKKGFSSFVSTGEFSVDNSSPIFNYYHSNDSDFNMTQEFAVRVYVNQEQPDSVIMTGLTAYKIRP